MTEDTTPDRGLSGGLSGAALTREQALALAKRHRLTEIGVRPPLLSYLRDTWRRRGFIVTLASAEARSQHQNYYLGQLWSLFNPAFLVLSYFLVFGLLLHTRGGTTNYLGFLTVGLFFFQFSSASLTKGARSITGNTGLVRALQFPRCVLPLSVVLTEFIAAVPTFGVLIVVMLCTGERPSLAWLLYVPAIALNLLIDAGLALMVARLVNSARDLANIVSVVVRLVRYISGVFFVIPHYAHGVLASAMALQPLAISLTIVRQSLMNESPPEIKTWVVALIWAIVLPVAGLIIFWRAEETYGRG